MIGQSCSHWSEKKNTKNIKGIDRIGGKGTVTCGNCKSVANLQMTKFALIVAMAIPIPTCFYCTIKQPIHLIIVYFVSLSSQVFQ